MENTKDLLNILPQYKGIIYDFDGTIATIDIDWQLLKDELTSHVRDKKGENIIFTPLDEKLQECKLNFGASFHQELLEIIANREVHSGLHLVDYSLVTYILQSKQKQALFTMNTTEAIELYIGELFGENPFDIIVTKNTCLSYKPSSTDVKRIVDFLQLDISSIVYIGDSENDKISANKAKVDFIFV